MQYAEAKGKNQQIWHILSSLKDALKPDTAHDPTWLPSFISIAIAVSQTFVSVMVRINI